MASDASKEPLYGTMDRREKTVGIEKGPTLCPDGMPTEYAAGYRISSSVVNRVSKYRARRALVPVPMAMSLSFCSPRAHWVVVSLVLAHNLPAEVDKNLVYVCSPSSAGLVIWDVSPILGDLERPRTWYHTILLQVRLVSYQDHRDVVIFFDPPYLLSELREFV